MDTTLTYTRARSVTPQPRDHSAPRRAYLDTYAKRRSGVETATESVPTVAVKMPEVSVPTQKPQPTVVAVPMQPAVYTPEVQPAVDTFSYERTDPSYNTSQVTEITPQVDTNSHKSYLDTLTRRHAQAVAEAPAAEETIMAPTLSSGTEDLLEDPEHDAKLEANLSALYSGSLTDQIATNTKSASAAHIRTIVASTLACGVLAVGVFAFAGRFNSQPVVAQPIGSPVIEVAASASQQPVGTPSATNAAAPVQADPSYPVRMVISSIGVNAPVEGLGTTPDGLIAVPKSYGMVGWYNKGSTPGKAGPAVLVGHYTGGYGGVFDKLKDLKNGDLITTTNGRGESYTYKVTVANEYDRDKVPMTDLFKTSSDSKLQIITCSGKWQAKNYDKRLVVTAEIVK